MREVLWTINAYRTYDDILDYLTKNWTEREYLRFIEKTQQLLNTIQKHPFSFQKSDKYPKARRAVLFEIISIYYDVNDTKITILIFWDSRRNPESLKLES